ncbi:MAG: thiamine phosphate synthase [Gammaproteobacteria bacterium]|nr:thiamine phosphate synthase [Gammaproteobacteria bacterium]
MTRPALPRRGIYAITPDNMALSALTEAVEIALEQGVDLLQYRTKSGDLSTHRAAARAFRRLCTKHGTLFIVNDDLELALAVEADGVHLGQYDREFETLAVNHTRDFLIGISCYNSLARARAALDAGADYIAFGSFYPSHTKSGAPPCAVDVLRDARAERQVPIIAIGGISPENGAALLAAGADYLAVANGIFGQRDVAAAAARLRALIEATESTFDV